MVWPICARLFTPWRRVAVKNLQGQKRHDLARAIDFERFLPVLSGYCSGEHPDHAAPSTGQEPSECNDRYRQMGVLNFALRDIERTIFAGDFPVEKQGQIAPVNEDPTIFSPVSCPNIYVIFFGSSAKSVGKKRVKIPLTSGYRGHQGSSA